MRFSSQHYALAPTVSQLISSLVYSRAALTRLLPFQPVMALGRQGKLHTRSQASASRNFPFASDFKGQTTIYETLREGP